jgi:hypothetical protein
MDTTGASVKAHDVLWFPDGQEGVKALALTYVGATLRLHRPSAATVALPFAS